MSSRSLHRFYELVIVMDNGSGTCKVGFVGDDAPRVVCRSVVGRPMYPKILLEANPKDVFIGEEAQLKRGVLKLSYPINRGIITNWDDMERIWRHCFYNELKVDLSESPIIVTEPPLNPKANREKIAQVLFETFDAIAIYVYIPAVLAVSMGRHRTLGLVVDSGEGVTCAVPVYDLYLIPHAVVRLDVAGRDVTQYLMKSLCERGYSFSTSAELEIIKEMKEKMCYVAQDFENEMINSKEETYELPDGNEVALGDERIRSPEVLFQPNLIGKQSPGIHEMIYSSLMKCDSKVRADFASDHIILSGGSTLFQGFAKRLSQELSALMEKKTNVYAIAGRTYAPWIGASYYGSVSSFQKMWITRDEYEESGPGIVHDRCLRVIAPPNANRIIMRRPSG